VHDDLKTKYCYSKTVTQILYFRYGVSDYAAAALANGLLKDFGLISDTDRFEVIDPSKISREKRRVGEASIKEREDDVYSFKCIGLDSKRDADVPVVLQVEEGGEARPFKTSTSVDNLTFTIESGKLFH